MRKVNIDKLRRAKYTVNVSKRTPAAVIEDANGNKVFVDKFGKEVQDTGYDLKKDPRGWIKNGYLKPQAELII